MTYEELVKALGLDTDESKDKAVILKKEYNAYQKEIKDLTDNVTELTATIEADKVVAEKFNSVVNAFVFQMIISSKVTIIVFNNNDVSWII